MNKTKNIVYGLRINTNNQEINTIVNDFTRVFEKVYAEKFVDDMWRSILTKYDYHHHNSFVEERQKDKDNKKNLLTNIKLSSIGRLMLNSIDPTDKITDCPKISDKTYVDHYQVKCVFYEIKDDNDHCTILAIIDENSCREYYLNVLQLPYVEDYSFVENNNENFANKRLSKTWKKIFDDNIPPLKTIIIEHPTLLVYYVHHRDTLNELFYIRQWNNTDRIKNVLHRYYRQLLLDRILLSSSYHGEKIDFMKLDFFVDDFLRNIGDLSRLGSVDWLSKDRIIKGDLGSIKWNNNILQNVHSAFGANPFDKADFLV